MAEKLTASYLLYSEAFTSQNGKGVYGPLPTADLSGVNWGLDFSYASLTAADDYAKVVSESFEFQDTDGIVSLESPFKDTSGFTNFFVEFELSESGDLEGTDMIETFYTLNNGTSYTSIDTRSGNFSDDNISDSLIVYIDEGNSIGLKFEAISNASGEFLRVDNLAIKSDTLNGASLEINSQIWQIFQMSLKYTKENSFWVIKLILIKTSLCQPTMSPCTRKVSLEKMIRE